MAAHLQFAQAWAMAFAERPQALSRCLLQGSLHTVRLSGQRKWKWFPYSTCGILASQSPWVEDMCQPCQTAQTAIRLDGVFVECWEEELGNIKCSYYCQKIHASLSWQFSSWSKLGMCFNRKCQAAGMEQMLLGWIGAQNSIRNTHVLSLTFLIKWDNNVIFFLEKQTTILFFFRPQYLSKENKEREINVSLTWNVGCFLLSSKFSIFKLIPSEGDSLKVSGLGYAPKQCERWWKVWATSGIESPLWSLTLTLKHISETL